MAGAVIINTVIIPGVKFGSVTMTRPVLVWTTHLYIKLHSPDLQLLLGFRMAGVLKGQWVLAPLRATDGWHLAETVAATLHPLGSRAEKLMSNATSHVNIRRVAIELAFAFMGPGVDLRYSNPSPSSDHLPAPLTCTAAPP